MHDHTSDPHRADRTDDQGAGGVSLLTSRSRARLILTGEVDGSLQSELSEAVAEAVRLGLAVEVDTRTVSFMDSSAITLLARLNTRVPGRLQFIDPPELVHFLLQVTRLAESVDVLPTDPGFPPAD